MHAFLQKFCNDDSGATAVEYGLMVALIAVVIIASVIIVGENLDAVFGHVGLHTALEGNP